MNTDPEKIIFRHDLLAERLDVLGNKLDIPATLGISKQHIWQIKTGKRLPSIPLLRKILDVTELSFDDLVQNKKVFLQKL